jgi:hypothetical protein
MPGRPEGVGCEFNKPATNNNDNSNNNNNNNNSNNKESAP